MAGRQVKVALLGARGRLGSVTLDALLSSTFNKYFSEIVAVGRKAPDITQYAAVKGVKIKLANADYTNDANLAEALEGADVVINCNNFPASAEEGASLRKEVILAAVQKSGAQLYFPSEFGVDWRQNDFDQRDWVQKRDHQLDARGIKNLKTVAIYTGLFTELSFGPWFGLDVKNRKLQPVGTDDVKASYTSLADVGRSIAAVCAKFAQLGSVKDLPDHLRIAGDTVSAGEIAHIFKEADPSHADIAIEPLDTTSYRAGLEADADSLHQSPAAWIRVVAGLGNLDHTQSVPKTFDGLLGEPFGGQTEASSDFVNDGAWSWTTVKDYAKRVKGRPWDDYGEEKQDDK